LSEARGWILSGVLRVSQHRRLLRMSGSEALLQIQDTMYHLGDVKGPKEKRDRIGKSGERETIMGVPHELYGSRVMIRQNRPHTEEALSHPRNSSNPDT